MLTNKRIHIRLYTSLALIGLLILYVWPSLVVALPLTAKHQLERAWRYAGDVGSYQYRTNVIQTTHPTARLENAGRHPKTQRLAAEGMVDRPNKTMTMKLWGQGRAGQALEVKVENGQAFGRTSATENWSEIDNPADIFAPGGDPLGFLVAAENIRQLTSDDTLETATVTGQAPDPGMPDRWTGKNLNRYAFDINGRQYAEYMRLQMQDYMRRQGELPPGVTLGLTRQYVDMKAQGEIWLNEEGLPVRQLIHLEFPPERGALNWYAADITTHFSNWDIPSLDHQLFWALPRVIKDPTIFTQDPLSLLPNLQALILNPQSLTPENLQKFGFVLGFSLLLAALAVMTITHRHSPRFYAAIAAGVIFSMLVVPLIRSNQAYAFTQRQQTRQAENQHERESQQSAEDLRSELSGRNFNPRLNPLDNKQLPPSNSSFTNHNYSSPQSPNRDPQSKMMLALDDTCSLSDSNADCDGDGLTNGVELYELGTDPENIDTDGDFISDKTEVEGFNDGQQWYLDPLNPDSNGDGLPDYVECSDLSDVDTDGTLTTPSGNKCQNIDGDTTPDVFDFDNDGDGVPDSADSSPTYTGNLTTQAQDEFNLNLKNYTVDKSLLVDIEIRPTDPDQLWQTNNVLDWPANDTEGQVTRVHDTTFLDESSFDSDAANLDNGDMLLTPMLEIKIPAPSNNASNPSGSLPISPDFSGDITDNTDLSKWLDQDTLDQYAISVSQAEDGASLYVYIPLTTIEDQYAGDTPVAWGAQMLYRPEVAAWGENHNMKLVWMITALVDTCDTSEMTGEDDYDTWCTNKAHWTTETSIIQTYYEDFYVTGLSVREENGFKSAVIAQTDADSVSYENYLWHLANNLQRTFLGSELVGGSRFDITEIENRFDDVSTHNTGDPELWGIPQGKLTVSTATFDDQISGLANLINTQIPDMLATTYPGAAPDTRITLLVAREESYRSTTLGDSSTTSTNGSTLTVDLDSLNREMYASLGWAPYDYDGATWLSYDLYDYLDKMETKLDSVIDTAALQTLLEVDDIEEEELTKTGVIAMAKNFYLAFSQEVTTIVEIDGVPASSDTVDDVDLNLNGEEAVLRVVDDVLTLIAAFFEAENTITVEGEVVANSLIGRFTDYNIILAALGLVETQLESDSDPEAIVAPEVADFANGWLWETLYKNLNGLSMELSNTLEWDKRIASSLTGVGAAVLAFGEEAGLTKRQAYILGVSLTAGQRVRTALNASITLAIYRGAKLYNTAEAAAEVSRIENVTRSGAIKFFVLGVVIVVGAMVYTMYKQNITPGSAEFSVLLAQSIAQLIVLIILTVISLTVVGALFVAVLALFDLLVFAICRIVGVKAGSDVDVWVCGGITGAVTNALVYLIFDMYVVADLTDKNRLEIAMNDPTIVQRTDNSGFVAGNELDLQMTITNTISLAKPTGLGSWQQRQTDLGFNLDELLLKSAFSYTLQHDKIDQHDNVELNQTDWDAQNRAVFQASSTASFESAGINKAIPDLYLTEAYNIPGLECWGFIVQVCGRRDFRDSLHNDLDQSFVFDILPATLSGFLRLTSSDNVNYRLGWDSQFPILADADGDGLRSQKFGGPDPDDGDPDTDDDGLSDFWEMENGFDPEDPDPDHDGLNDYWEAFYGTNPWVADGDHDGLEDGEEFFHSQALSAHQDDNTTWSGGWAFVYDYDSSDQPLQTWVSADPDSYDTDGDTILDNLEFNYGYNPNLTSELNVLSLESEIETTTAGSGFVLPGATIGYTATIKNELDNRVANGLLEVEFPVDTVQTREVIGSLYPQRSVTTSGAVTAPSVSQSQATSLTIRAGAVIDTSAVNQVFVLNLDEGAGSTTFFDATSNRLDFTCSDSACPTANSGFLDFDGNDQLDLTIENATSKPDPFIQTAFSIAAWVKPTATPDSSVTLYQDVDDFVVKLDTAGKIGIVIDGNVVLTSGTALTTDQWNHVLATFNQNSGDVNLYINGRLAASKFGVPDIVPSYPDGDERIIIGQGFEGSMDYISMYGYALTGADVADLFSSLTFYATFDQDGCGNYIDSISYQSINCGGSPDPISANGIFNDAIKFKVSSLLSPGGFAKVAGNVPLAGSDNAFTIAAWLKPDFIDFPVQDLLSVESTANDQFKVWRNYGDLELKIDGCGTKSYYNFFESKRWVHLTITFDGTSALTLYRDGEQFDNTESCTSIPNLQTLDLVQLGRATSDHIAFYGRLDELRFYSKALSADEVTALYSNNRTLQLAFDEPPGQSTFADTSPNAFIGSCVGNACPDTGLPGRANQAVRFDGSNDVIELPTADVLLGDESFTVLAWIKGDDFSDIHTILGTDEEATNKGLRLGVNHGKVQMGFFNNALFSNTVLETDQWYHLAWRYTLDEDSGLGEQAIFINGTLDKSATDKSPFAGTGTLKVGRSRGGAYFDGLIDHLVIVKDALSEAEIQAIMNEGPVLNLHLDEDMGATTFIDDSPNQNDATCTNCPQAGAKGQMREAPLFDGDDDELTIAADDAFNLESFSLALWVKPIRLNSGFQDFIRKDNGSEAHRNFILRMLGNSTQLRFGIQATCDGSGDFKYFDSNNTLIENQWNHVVATYDNDKNFMALYINGTLDQSKKPSLKGVCTDSQDMVVGRNVEGLLDEVTIYGKALNALEVEDIYDYQAAWFDTSYQHLVTIDADDPIVSLELPDYLPLEPTLLAISAVDPTSNVGEVEVTLTPPGGGSTTTPAEPSESGDGTWLYNFDPLEAGEYTLSAVATDSVGRTSSDSKTFYVDDTPPTADLDSSLTSAVQPVTNTLALFGSVSDSGNPASGVADNTIAVDVRDRQGSSVQGFQYGTSDSSTWQVDYPFVTPPYGQYEVWAGLEDNVGNVYSDTIGSIQLDGYGPNADIALTTPVISNSGTVLSGSVSDILYPQEQMLLNAHFEEAAGASEFADSSPNHWLAECTSCPTAGVAGQYGNAAEFDGTDDALTLSNESFFDLQEMTLAVWVKVDTFSQPWQAIVTKGDTAWRLHRHRNTNTVSFGTNGLSNLSLVGTTNINDGQWHHLAAVYDGQKKYLYIDGILEADVEVTGSLDTNDDPVQIGANSQYGRNFDGLIDEVLIYDHALSAEEIYDMANPLPTSIAQAQIRFRHAENADEAEDEDTWYDLSLASTHDTFTTWQFAVPTISEGPYKIDLRAEDSVGNSNYIPNAWSGEIDLFAPRLTFGYTLDESGQTIISCQAEDYNLTTTNFVCPLTMTSTTPIYQDADWFTRIFSGVNKLKGLVVTAPLQPLATTVTMTACDEVGHCASQTLTSNDASKLTVTKEVVNDDGGTLQVSDFPLFVDGFLVTSGQQNTLLAGTYVVSETGDASYTATIGGDCAADGSITLDPGDVKICTITNDDINVAPTVEAGEDQTVNEGETVSLDPATFNDVGTLDTHTATIDWGDGTAPDAGAVTIPPIEPGDPAGVNGTVDGSHVYADNGFYTVEVCVTDDDEATTCDTLNVTVNNVAPILDAGGDQTVNEGDIVLLDPATFNDLGTLDTHTATIDWGDGTAPEAGVVFESPFGPPGDAAGANGMVSGSHVYAGNDLYTVTICVTDDDGDQTCDTLTVTVKNLPPVVEAGPDQTINEGETVILGPATFTNSGLLDTHTATIDWGEGAVDVGLVTEPSGGADGTVAGSHTYGDNGSYAVTVCVTDDEGAEGCDSFIATVNNLNPAVALDTSAAIAMDGGKAFIGRRDHEQSFIVDANDPGSDDLTVRWSFPSSSNGASTTYFNNGLSPDPLPSPHGTFPFLVVDGNRSTFDAPGVYSVDVKIKDDDGGRDTDSLPLLITGNRGCTKVDAFWRQQFRGNGPTEIDTSRLQGYLGIIRFTSAYYDSSNLGSLADAEAILSPGGGKNPSRRAQQAGLAAWLNFAAGGVLWDETIPHLDERFSQAIASIDATLLDPNASKQDYNAAMQDAIHINNIRPSQAHCDDDILPSVPPNNDPPTVNIPQLVSGPLDEGSPLVAMTLFSDPNGVNDGHTCTVDYGDGSGPQEGIVTGNFCTGPNHIYADNGDYDVTIWVTDSSNASGQNRATHSINNVAPVVEAVADQTIKIGDSVLLELATFTDLGILDTHTATIDWGDGTVDTGLVTEPTWDVDGNITGSHTYDMGLVTGSSFETDDSAISSQTDDENVSSTVTVCVADNDGGETCDNLTITAGKSDPDDDAAAANGSVYLPLIIKDQ